MPKVTLYIREDDFEKWKLIKNKSELVSQAINRSEITVEEQKNGTFKTVQTILTPPTTALYTKEVSSPIRPDIQKGVDDGTISIDKPEKNNSVGKPTKKNICPEHLVDKDICRLMKHKGNK